MYKQRNYEPVAQVDVPQHYIHTRIDEKMNNLIIDECEELGLFKNDKPNKSALVKLILVKHFENKRNLEFEKETAEWR